MRGKSTICGKRWSQCTGKKLILHTRGKWEPVGIKKKQTKHLQGGSGNHLEKYGIRGYCLSNGEMQWGDYSRHGELLSHCVGKGVITEKAENEMLRLHVALLHKCSATEYSSFPFTLLILSFWEKETNKQQQRNISLNAINMHLIPYCLFQCKSSLQLSNSVAQAVSSNNALHSTKRFIFIIHYIFLLIFMIN